MQRIVLCGRCHSQIAPGQQFCPNCGARVCPHCNSAVPPRSRFCPNCGFLCGSQEYGRAVQAIPTPTPVQAPRVVPRVPTPPSPPSPQDITRQQAPEVPVMWHQYSCPQCGASIDIASGQCPKCGLLLGKKLIQKMQQQVTPAMPTAASPTPPTRPQSATGPHLGGIYGREPQYNYPGYGATAPPSSGYPPSYGSPGGIPYGGMQQAPRPAPVAASTAPATVSPPMPAGSYPYQVVRPAPREWGIPPPTRRFLLRISTTILLAIVGFIGISYAVTQLGTPSDITPPIIQSVSVLSVTNTSAVIEWETDEPATSQVMVCDPGGVCSWTDPVETLVTNHSVTLSDLKPNTSYHLTLISEDESGNEATPFEQELKTSAQADTTPPMISGVDVSNITNSSATITWTTDEPAASQVEYGTTDAYVSTTAKDEALTTSHSVTLTELEPDTTYHFRVKSEDASGNEATSEGELTTSAQADATPPVISEVDVSNITNSSATITWTTDEPAASQVEYGETDAYGSTTPLDEELTTSHSVTLTELDPETSYHFRVKSEDASGNEAISETDQTFTTLSSVPVGTEEGYLAPDFNLYTIDDEELLLSDFLGKIVMINFWYVGCAPCESEMPHLQAVFESWSGDEELVILAINRRDNADAIRNFMDIHSYTFTVLLDSLGTVHALYDNISLWPTTFFIDADGVIQEIQVGAFSSQEEIESILESL